MVEIVRTARTVEIDESDIISLSQAADLLGREVSTIANMLDRGVLPWYEMAAPPGIPAVRAQRYTSRAAAEKLPKQKSNRGPTPRTAGAAPKTKRARAK